MAPMRLSLRLLTSSAWTGKRICGKCRNRSRQTLTISQLPLLPKQRHRERRKRLLEIRPGHPRCRQQGFAWQVGLGHRNWLACVWSQLWRCCKCSQLSLKKRHYELSLTSLTRSLPSRMLRLSGAPLLARPSTRCTSSGMLTRTTPRTPALASLAPTAMPFMIFTDVRQLDDLKRKSTLIC